MIFENHNISEIEAILPLVVDYICIGARVSYKKDLDVIDKLTQDKY
jgi:hypothetical protein